MCENNSQGKNTEQKKLEDRMWLLTKEISNKNKKLAENEKTIDRMTKREKEMKKRESKQSKEMEKSRAESIEAEKRFRQSMRTADEDKGKGLPGILGVDNA